ncbi:MAG: winged helix-turn-helix transcriptional regulator [Euryarchaeota archaeon]|nr:winged helix-turn-helix transcriptional regulator [Euryarchaeota archaeon]
MNPIKCVLITILVVITMKLDEIDAKILEALLRDGRISYRLLARELNISPPTVSSKIEKLLELGVIRGYTAIIDHTKLGQMLVFIVMEKLPDDISQLEPIRIVYKTADGRYLAISTVYGLEELYDVLSHLRESGVEFDYYITVGEPIKDEPLVRIRKNLSVRIRCANCGNIIEGEPIKKVIMRKIYYFCSEECLREFNRY